MSYDSMTLPDLLRKVASELREAGERERSLQEKVAGYEDKEKLAALAADLEGTVVDPEGAINTIRESGHDIETIKAAAALIGGGAPDGGIFKVSSESGGTDSTEEFMQLVQG